MKNIFLSLLLIVSGLVSGQNHYRQDKPKQLIFDGNSIFNLTVPTLTTFKTFGFDVSTRVYSQFVNSNNKTPVFDYSFQGKTTPQLTSDFLTKVAPYVKSNDILVFTELKNDLAAGTTTAQAITNLYAYVTQAKQYVNKVYVLTCLPEDAGRFSDASRLALNSFIIANPSFCDGVIDPCTLTQFDSQADCSSTVYFYQDKLHTQTAGANLIGDMIYTYINSQFP